MKSTNSNSSITLTRRQFIQRSAAAATVAWPMLANARPFGANDEIRVAIVGCGGRGGSHIAGFGPQKGVRIDSLVKAIALPDYPPMPAGTGPLPGKP